MLKNRQYIATVQLQLLPCKNRAEQQIVGRVVVVLLLLLLLLLYVYYVCGSCLQSPVSGTSGTMYCAYFVAKYNCNTTVVYYYSYYTTTYYYQLLHSYSTIVICNFKRSLQGCTALFPNAENFIKLEAERGIVDYIAIGYFILVSIKISYFVLGKKTTKIGPILPEKRAG